MVNVLESTLEWTQGEVTLRSGIGSNTPCFSLDSASGCTVQIFPRVPFLNKSYIHNTVKIHSSKEETCSVLMVTIQGHYGEEISEDRKEDRYYLCFS
jgi:hypothetical protein